MLCRLGDDHIKEKTAFLSHFVMKTGLDINKTCATSPEIEGSIERRTPLSIVCEPRPHLSLEAFTGRIRAVLSLGVDPNGMDSYWGTPLQQCITDILRTIRSLTGPYGVTEAMLTVLAAHQASATALVEGGASLELRDQAGKTPLERLGDLVREERGEKAMRLVDRAVFVLKRAADGYQLTKAWGVLDEKKLAYDSIQ
jgi:hypothetical protein